MNTIDRYADNNTYKKTKNKHMFCPLKLVMEIYLIKDMSEYIIKQSVSKFLDVSILAFRKRKLP